MPTRAMINARSSLAVFILATVGSTSFVLIDFPNLPTMIEAGVPDYVVTSFFGVVAPAGTPAPVIARLNAVINEALRTEPVQAALKKLGAEPTIESPEEFTRFIAAEMRKWTEIAAIAGIKAD